MAGSDAGCASARCRQRGPGVADGAGLCRNCKDDVRRDLAELPDLYRKCEELLVNAPSRQPWERPCNAAAAAVRSEILGTLASWSGLVVSERRVGRGPCRTAADLLPFSSVTSTGWPRIRRPGTWPGLGP